MLLNTVEKQNEMGIKSFWEEWKFLTTTFSEAQE